MDGVLVDILRAAEKHPNSKVSKLIRTVEAEPSQKNIVLLLIELSDHTEYSIDFNISLRYYLDLFERFGLHGDLILNEAGLLLVNSSKIYAKRVDYVQSLVEHQITTLSKADLELQQQAETEKNAPEEPPKPAEKPKRGRKRVLDVGTDRFEIQLEPKKFKKLTQDKRFSSPKASEKPKVLTHNSELDQQTHPAVWKYATIYDLENDEDVDTKRNYKLFTYHVEHRYNTLVPDINFRLHFKVKDYMDAQEYESLEGQAEDGVSKEWPSLPEEYVRRCISLENRIFQHEIDPSKPYISPQRHKPLPSLNTSFEVEDEIMTIEVPAAEPTAASEHVNSADITAAASQPNEQPTLQNPGCNEGNNISANDSGLGNSLWEDSEMDFTQEEMSLIDKAISDAESSMLLAQSIENASNANKDTNEAAVNGTTLEKSQEGSADDSAVVLNESLANNSLLDAENNLLNTNATEAVCNHNVNPSECAETVATELENVASQGASVAPDGTPSTEQTCSAEKGISETAAVSVNDSPQNEISDKEGTTTQDETCDDKTKVEKSELTQEGIILKDENGEEIRIEAQNASDASYIPIQVPKSIDDEGVHLTESFERDLQRNSTPLKVPLNINDIERKDVTIFLDDETRRALQNFTGFDQNPETYKLPMENEAKEKPLVWNILQLPSKLIRRKVLFKLGADMDLYMKARMGKHQRVALPAKATTARRMKFFPLNNTDMTGIPLTPPHSPGQCSEFLGFTDDESTCDTCNDFCGFTEEETNKPLGFDRLSRDSGVDDIAISPEKEPLAIILEEGFIAATGNVKANLSTQLDANSADQNESTKDLLEGLSADIRSVLELALQSDDINDKGDDIAKDATAEKQNDPSPNTPNEKEHSESNPTIANNTVANSAENSDEISNKKAQDTNANTSDTSNVEATLVPENVEKPANTTNDTSPSVLETGTNGNDKSTHEMLSSSNNDALQKNDEAPAPVNEANKLLETNVNVENVLGEKAEEAPAANVTQVDSIPENNEESRNFDDAGSENYLVFDLDTQGSKTKIQQWHEHLRPVLAKSRERHHFDVFKLGTEIIKTINCEEDLHEDMNQSATFADVMADKDTSYVSRYFLSTLLLANQSNVEISVANKSSEQPSAWSDINLRLLSTKRHTVAIEDNIGMISTSNKRSNADTDGAATATERKKLKAERKHELNPAKRPCSSDNLMEERKKPKSSESYNNCMEEAIDQTVELQRMENAACGVEDSNALHPDDVPGTSRQALIHQHLPATELQQPATSALSVVQQEPPATMQGFALHQNELPAAGRETITHQRQGLVVDLSNVRVLQPIAKSSRQGDDSDSGVFSVDNALS